MSRLRAAGLRVALAAFSLFIVLAGFEVLLRAGERLKSKGPSPRKDRASLNYYREESRAHPWTKRGEKPLRIVVIGDSIAEGWGIQVDDCYGYRLERLLNLNDGQRPVEVEVWAKGGTTAVTQLPLLKDALKWRPDMVILGICLNDAEDPMQMERLHRWRDEMMPRVPPPWLGWVLRKSKACAWLYEKAESLRAHRGYLKYYERIYSPDYSGWKLFKRSVRKIRNLCETNKVTLVTVVFPAIGFEVPYPFDYAHARIREFLASENIKCLDLLEDFRGLDANRLEAVPYLDAHPNEIAHRIAAQAIFDFLLANSLIDPGYAPRLMKGSKEKYWNRIEQRMQKPQWETAPPELENGGEVPDVLPANAGG